MAGSSDPVTHGNRNLNASKAARQDEFYTQIQTVEDELRHYRPFFLGKSVFCNCDDPFESAFFRYFALNFNALGLKRLTCTCYSGSPITGTQLRLFGDEDEEQRRTPYRAVVTSVKDVTGDGGVDIDDIRAILESDENAVTRLAGTGDFRSDECMSLLGESDVVVTNPPFSMAESYLSTLLNSGKRFIVLGNINHALYARIFPRFVRGEFWLGYNSGHMWFNVPDYYEPKRTDYKEVGGQKMRRMGNICWFTNIDIEKRHEPLDLYETYSPDRFPKYDNFDAIHVSRTAQIPKDYYGNISVPITYLPYHCPEQFDLVGEVNNGCDSEYDFVRAVLNGKPQYKRIIIRRTEAS